ncbi:HXXEE domain-containing protein [Paenibacillus flagellatus]|uniref:HXXEE domain-containing protein n=1 Tax=Paenibacillus flagellatus TaxID=2211139 RepID=A0A2V5KA05_9BACL|nr:HXXEE domain-containing protein [Paenibacillus flagellatus]PYI56379.1 HXXEE domain-containing protein [Paenibacillus flagellatus]
MMATVKRFLPELPLRTVVWLFPLVFLIHDTEELVLIESWLGTNGGALAAKLKLGFPGTHGVPWTTPRFAAAVAVLFTFICIVCRFAARPGASAKARGWFAATIAVLFVNVFTHTAQSLLLGRYTPGVTTALVVVLPYTLYTLDRLVRERWIAARYVRTLLLAAAALLAAGAVGALLL